jgi:hypothetical protein
MKLLKWNLRKPKDRAKRMGCSGEQSTFLLRLSQKSIGRVASKEKDMQVTVILLAS